MTAGSRAGTVAARPRHLRARDGAEQATAPVELFFDLVYVLAITQLSHLLIGRLEPGGLLEVGFLLLVVWWAWINTTWITNLLDPASTPVRLLLLGCMAASLVMAAALPRAFGHDGAAFAGAFVALQVGRNALALRLVGPRGALGPAFARLTAWSVASGVLWLAGGLAGEGARPVLWSVALVVDLAGPRLQYAFPGLGRGTTADWDVDGGHFAERFQLLVVVALGESIVVGGATAAEAGLSGTTVAALVVALAETVALWWLYFERVAESSRRIIAGHDEAGRLARDAYTYLHIPIVGGIIGAAVGTELVLLHPGDELHGVGLGVVVGAPVLYLAGEAGFRWVMARRVSPLRLTAMAGLGALALPALVLPALAVAAAVTGLLGGLAWAEFRADAAVARAADPA